MPFLQGVTPRLPQNGFVMPSTENNAPTLTPEHVAIIMDGNGRWAKKRGLPRLAGHRAGAQNLRRILQACSDFGIKHLTIYAFSTENWGRPAEEVTGLMSLLEEVLDRELRELHKNGVQIRHIGSLDSVSKRLALKIKEALTLTRNNNRLVLNVAFNYGGRDEVVQTIRNIINDGLSPEEITEDVIDSYLYTAGQPDPDLVIRTSGEMRLSNFLLWQSAYAELVFTEKLWPDFCKQDLTDAISEFRKRERRYGATGV